MESLKKRSARSGDTAPIDNDPEELETFAQSADSDSELDSDEETFTGRDHYEAVGKSKLREPQEPTLGKQYAGLTVSRTALNGYDNQEEEPFAAIEEDSDDPFAKDATESDRSGDSEIEHGHDVEMVRTDGEDQDEEIDSDEAFGDGDTVKFKSFNFPGSKSRRSLVTKTDNIDPAAPTRWDSDEMVEDSDLEDSNGQASEADNSESHEDIDSEDGDVSSEAEVSDDDSASTASTSPEVLKGPAATSSDREALKAILAHDTAAVASTLSAAAESDAKKGKAVKEQYQQFDRLLDARIKLQKGLAAANGLTQGSVMESENRLAIEKAEAAAISLWSTVESIRHSLLDTQSSSDGLLGSCKKRKRPPPPTTQTSTAELWSRTESLEAESLPYHRSVLDKWSSKARAASAIQAPRSQLIDRSSQYQNNITAILDTYLVSESDKLFAQASASSNKSSSSPSAGDGSEPQLTYDDTPFYQSLLRELIASRSSTSSNTLSSTSTALLPSITRLHTAGSKNKRIDTKASKGRKIRYTVHEKLQNFAAEEERGTWEESARREFFSSLFGARRMLDENDNDGELDGEAEDGMVDGEVEALRLFRN